jgi:ABC-2 type transport system permease protein
MKKMWLIALLTYRRQIRSGTFLILTFGLPLLMVVAGAIPVLSAQSSGLPHIGYVDQTGRLSDITQVHVEDSTLTLTHYADTRQAQAAVQRGEISGYLVIPSGYFQGQKPVFYGEKEPGLALNDALASFMRRAMLPNQPDWVLDRLADPSNVTYVAQPSGEAVSPGPDLLIRVATPIALALVFALTIFMGASQMGSAIVREKDQRSMEMIITSLRPRELVVGKVLGMTLVTLTQIAIWTIGGGIAIGLALAGSGAQNISFPWEALVWGLLLGVPGYFLYAVLAAGLGVIAGDRQQARQLAGLLGFVGLSPLYFLGLLVNAINSPLALALTWFPLTAPMIALFRMALTSVPRWQLLVSLAILLVSLLVSIWFVARIFRAAMLIYGQSLRPRQIWQALRQA